MNTWFSENIVFKEDLPSIDAYWNLFTTTNWNDEYNFNKEELEKAIRNSWYQISCYDKESLVGYGRIIADGIHHALIVDLIIHPDYQGEGFGSEILSRLVAECKKHKIRDIQLFSAKGKYKFYEKFGFIKRDEDAPGMQLIN